MNQSKYYKSFGNWYKDNLAPVFDEVNYIIVTEAEKQNADILFGHWWAIFFKNSIALFKLVREAYCSYQITMTMRWLMEIVADVDFVTRNQINIEKLKFQHKKLLDKDKGKLTYMELAREAKKFRLYNSKNGKCYGDATRTIDRIKEAYDKDGQAFYDYLNCFAHFSYLGVMYDLNLNLKPNSPTSLKERTGLVQFYPKIFNLMIKSMGKLCNVDKLKTYDCSQLEKVVRGLQQ